MTEAFCPRSWAKDHPAQPVPRMAIVGLLCVTSCGVDVTEDVDENACLTVDFDDDLAGVEAWERVVGAIAVTRVD